MKAVVVTLDHVTKTFHYLVDEQGDESYKRIKTAMSEFKEYGNDREKTVTIDTMHGESTIRVAAIRTVAVEAVNDQTMASLVELTHQMYTRKLALEAAYKERGIEIPQAG